MSKNTKDIEDKLDSNKFTISEQKEVSSSSNEEQLSDRLDSEKYVPKP